VILINLLPHREEKRKRKKVAFFVSLAIAAAGGVVIAGGWYAVVEQLKAAQQSRNQFLSAEIKKLENEIKDIATLKAEIASLMARQKAVEDLQIDRNMPVNLLNELVNRTPEGLYFASLKQDGTTLNMAGIAQTQERISELLRNTAYKSEWLASPDLIESKATTITGANKEQKRLFDFSVRLTTKRPQDKTAAPADGVPVAAPAGNSSATAAAVSNKL